MWFFTADLHLNHNNIIKYCERPFMNILETGLMQMVRSKTIPVNEVAISDESSEKMTNHIIDSINEVVSANDKLVIAGDFCHTRSSERDSEISRLRGMINCKNVYLIIGNHDDRSAMSKSFTCFDQYTFNINGQNVFVSHYPCRSWNKSSRGSWMLYGHVHGGFSREDSLGFSENDERMLLSGFKDIVGDDVVCAKLVEVARKSRQRRLTLDVGVDNRRDGFRFGSPWSFDDIRKYMSLLA